MMVASDHFQSDRCAKVLKALGEPLRLRIVDVLRDGPMNVSDLTAEIDAEIVIVSHHLGVLYNAGLVQREKQGRFVVYRLREGMLPVRSSPNGKEHLDLGCCRLEVPRS